MTEGETILGIVGILIAAIVPSIGGGYALIRRIDAGDARLDQKITGMADTLRAEIKESDTLVEGRLQAAIDRLDKRLETLSSQALEEMRAIRANQEAHSNFVSDQLVRYMQANRLQGEFDALNSKIDGLRPHAPASE